ncbi:acyl-CoA thioesterase [Virgibacillus sp. NKC19-3]|uniref:acyl-CoA thioesterase n=1 Tax=Virgibacillus saliphilus TaxID=2831674 RepID=UPI001C9AF149|nr:acyl-CoA thioesterase [Virgibacillus sp. NKC19-3]MBY7144271.1 acyl-CoA thioesterase [Virgibacillus sp. NKC19-3]
MDIKVRFGETDMLGHINNTSYFKYMEETRIEFLQTWGADFRSGQFTFILASAKCDFIRQGYFGQTLEVDTKVVKIGRTSVTLSTEMVEKESGDMIAKGEATVVYFDVRKQKPTVIPERMKSNIEADSQGGERDECTFS